MNALAALVLFLNFDGATVTVGPDDSATDTSSLPTTFTTTKPLAAFDATPYAPYYDAASAQAYIARKVTYWYAPYDVSVVTTRPTNEPYAEILVGDTFSNFATTGIDAVGLAHIDCGNATKDDVAFDFSVSVLGGAMPMSANDAQVDLLLVAGTAAHEAGHAFGLEHVSDTNDLMSPQVSAGVVGFVDKVNALVSASQCGSATTQNSAQLLVTNVGAAPPSDRPTLTLTPADGAVVGETFVASVTVSDTLAIANVELDIGSLTIASATSPPYEFNVTAPSDGSLTLTAIATNSQGGIGSVSTTFTVQANAPSSIPDASTTPAHSSGGCSLGTGSTTSGGSLVVLLLLLLLRRARPSAT